MQKPAVAVIADHTSALSILLIEDSEDDAELALRALGRGLVELSSRRVESATELRAALDERQWDLVLCDHGLPAFGVLDALEILQATGTDVPFVVLSGTIGEEAAVKALKAGAADVVLKSNLSRLASVAERELRAAADRRTRRLAEVALRESEARKAAVLESVLDAIVTIDAEGRIVEFNRAAERMFVRARADVIGQLMGDLIVPPLLRERHRAGLSAYLATGEPTILNQRLTMTAMRSDGHEFPVELAVVPIDMPGQVMFTASIRDITGQERLQRELQQAQRLESLGLLAGGVAHDFNNLLGVIMNYAHFVNQRVVDDPQATADLEAIVEAAERAAQLTRQLLAFGRREIVNPRVIDLNSVLAQIERLLRRTMGEHLELTSVLHPDLWPVWADPGQVEQVLVNLAVNARDAMTNGGCLSLRTLNIDIDPISAGQFRTLTPGRYVCIRVTDTGSGMDADTAARAFEPFFTTKPKGEGTGLGLATVYGIVHQGGGDVHLYSEPGRGTTVSVYLPASGTPVPAQTGTTATPTVHGGHETVLVVEDEDAFREMARRILVERGYTVLVAAHAGEAMAHFAVPDAHIDLVLTDVVMPGRSGIDLAADLSATHPDLPVLFMSGYAESIVSGDTEITAAELIAKPFTEATLLARIRSVLDRPLPAP